MTMLNSDIAELFDQVADLLEIQGANPFRVRAYRNASRVISNWPTSLSALAHSGKKPPKIPGLGTDLMDKVIEAAKTRTFPLFEELKRKTPPGLLGLLKLPGIGPKRVARLQEELKVKSVADLERVLKEGRLKELDGFGPKIEQRLREELGRLAGISPKERSRTKWISAKLIGEPLLSYLRAVPGVKQAAIAGSFRRRLATVADLDILVSSNRKSTVMEAFLAYEDVAEILAKGETRSTVLLRGGMQVDLRVLSDASYGAALHYFTGSKAHNIAIRTLGVKRGLKISEYGVFRGQKRIGGKTELDVFKSVGLPYIEPELRENQGEIEAARLGKLPDLIRLEQIRGDLHAHTQATDGRLSIPDMAAAARELGYEYLAITDHSKHLAFTKGFDSRRLAAQIREIDELNEKFPDFRILKSIEVDILEDGSLDLPDSILSRLDLTVCSIHSHFNLPSDKQTQRILRAMENPYFRILGHPTERILGRRPPLEFDMEQVMRAARSRGCFLEVNAQPERMDLSDVHCRLAKESGVMLVISTDAHSDHELKFMELGVSQARRGWIEAQDVLNTRSWKEIEALIRGPVSRVAA